MMKLAFVSLVVLLNSQLTRASFSSIGDVEGPEDVPIKQAWGKLHASYPRVIGELVSGLQMGAPARRVFRQLLESRTQRTMRTGRASERCDQCVEIVGLLKSVLDLGLDFEDVRDISVDICHGLVEGEYHPELLCPGIVDNFGPHVVYVLNATDKDPEEICLVLDDCSPDDITPFYRQSLYPQKPLQKHLRNKAIPRRSSEGNPIKILHLTDIHVDPDYHEGGKTSCGMPNCCREMYNNGTGNAGQYGDWQCNVPKRTTELFLQHFSTMNPDYVVYTGDSPPHFVWLETQEYQLSVNRYVAEEIAKYFPDTPVFTSIGNHETFPTNLYYVGRQEIQEFNEQMTLYWKELSNFTPEEEQTFRAGCYFNKLLRPGLRLISYNTNYGAGSNYYNVLSVDEQDLADMNAFLRSSVTAARNNGEKVILLGHHMSQLRYQDEVLNEILSENSDTVILHLFGHSHLDNFKLLSDPSDNEVYNVKISMAAMTSSKNINPSARIILLDPSDFTPVDAETYNLDLANIVEENPQIRLAYRHSEEYGMANLLPASWQNMTDRMFSDEALFRRYWYNRQTRTGQEEECDATCYRKEVCKLRFSGEAARACEQEDTGKHL